MVTSKYVSDNRALISVCGFIDIVMPEQNNDGVWLHVQPFTQFNKAIISSHYHLIILLILFVFLLQATANVITCT